jgi:hypothetical protein
MRLWPDLLCGFLGTFLYLAAFLGNVFAAELVDSPQRARCAGVQYSARQGFALLWHGAAEFKKWWTRFV